MIDTASAKLEIEALAMDLIATLVANYTGDVPPTLPPLIHSVFVCGFCDGVSRLCDSATRNGISESALAYMRAVIEIAKGAKKREIQ